MKKKLKILYEDKYLIAVSKNSGKLTISDGKILDNLYSEVYTYLKQKNKNNKVFIVHRLDKDTSGIVLFAKNENVKKLLQNNWNLYERKYYALVCGQMPKKSDTLHSYLKETSTLLVYSTDDNIHGKEAITEYNVLKSNNEYSLLDINIKTGRKNQIRVQLNDINHSIVGDKKYCNKKKNPLRRLCLHAYSLKIIHPITKKELLIEDPKINFVLIK